jgi:hypothetical protein
MRRWLVGGTAVAVVAFTLGAMTRTFAQSWAPPDHVSSRFQKVQAEVAAEAEEDLRAAPGDKPIATGHLANPYAPTPKPPLSLDERQVRALERIARALEARCSNGGPATSTP